MCETVDRIMELGIKSTGSIRILIVVVTYNCEKFVDYIIDSLNRQVYDLSRVLLVVIDNASKDHTLNKMLLGLRGFSKLNWLVVRLSRNYGFVLANNAALYLAKKLLGDLNSCIVVFLNPDTRIFSEHFLWHVELLSSRFPIVGFAMVSGDNDVVDSLGAYVDYLGSPQDILCGVRISTRLAMLIKRLPLLYSTPYVCFAAVAVRGDVLESLGFLRPFYVMYFEDTEYCLRAWSKGSPVLVHKEFMIWHARGGTQASTLGSGDVQSRDKVLDIMLHFSKNSLLLTYEYLGVIRFLLRSLMYLVVSISLRRKRLARAFCEALKIIVRERIKPRKLPKGLVLFDFRTWVLLWALKCLLQGPSRVQRSLQGCIVYGVQRASFEYLCRRVLRMYNRT